MPRYNDALHILETEGVRTCVREREREREREMCVAQQYV